MNEPTCAHWISAGIAGSNYPTGHALTSYGFGCPYCEIERLRAALQQIIDIETEYEGCEELAREALGEPKP